MNMPVPPIKPGDAALAEFNALRAEIVARSNAQTALVGAGFAAIGVAVGLAFNGKGGARVAIAIPFLAAAIILAYTFESVRIMAMGAYIRVELWPFIAAQADCEIPSWERHRRKRGRGGISVPRLGIAEGAIVGVFLIAGVASAIAAPTEPVLLKVVGCIVVIASAGAAILLVRLAARP